jgi:hypothetical protein
VFFFTLDPRCRHGKPLLPALCRPVKDRRWTLWKPFCPPPPPEDRHRPPSLWATTRKRGDTTTILSHRPHETHDDLREFPSGSSSSRAPPHRNPHVGVPPPPSSGELAVRAQGVPPLLCFHLAYQFGVIDSWTSIIKPTCRIRSWIHKISTVHRDFHGRENVPLRILISATDLEVNGWHLMSTPWIREPIPVDLVHGPIPCNFQ